VLDKIAAALAVALEALFKVPGAQETALIRRTDQLVWRDPSSGYLRRSVSPPGIESPLEIVEVTFPPGARVTFESGPRRRRVHEQLWVLEGTIDFTFGGETHRLGEGDCFALRLDQPTTFQNSTHGRARYAVISSTL
jgi:quercetin dioxygenase-like cupin family protein